MLLRITDDTTRDDLAITLEILNAEAKKISRRGKIGTLTDDYEVQHTRINVVLSDWEKAPA